MTKRVLQRREFCHSDYGRRWRIACVELASGTSVRPRVVKHRSLSNSRQRSETKKSCQHKKKVTRAATDPKSGDVQSAGRAATIHQRSVLRLLPRVLREGALRPLPVPRRGQSVPNAPSVRESGAARPRTGRGAPRAARGGACRSDQTKIEPRSGAHYTEARGGVGVRGLPVAIITVLRSTFLFLADTPSTDSAGRHAIAATPLVLRATYSV